MAALITNEFALSRTLGMMMVGSTLYALEIPNYFRWIDRRSSNQTGWALALRRTLLALAYFNPLWIARHLFFIKVFSAQWAVITPQIFVVGTYSFLANIPIAFLANYMIQNKLPYDWRFTGSALFSAAMAIYYALSEVFFA